jgi:CheY-like chemotaxis protein
MVGEKHYDLVFMDIQMPEVDGVEATKRIRALDIKQPIIVALTADVTHYDREHAMADGMDAYIPKPANLNNLSETIQLFVGRLEANKSL